MPLQIRRGTEAQRLDPSINLTLAEGELLWVTNDKKLYIGDGTTLAANLLPVTGFNEEDARDAAASLFTTATHTNISFTYDDNSNTLSASVNLSNYNGVIKASAFNGSLVADDSTELVNAIDSKINLDGTVKGHIIPAANVTYDLGSATNRFRDLYLSGSSIKLGGATITASGSSVDLPAGSTVNGVLIGSDSSGSFVGDVTGSVFGDDSTLLVDGISNRLSTGGAFLTLTQDSILSGTTILNIGENATPVGIFQTGREFEVKISNSAGSLVNAPVFRTKTSRGTLASPSTVLANDYIGIVSFQAYSSDTDDYVGTAGIIAAIDTDVSNTATPGKIALSVNSQTDTVIEASLNSFGVFTAPIIKATSYATSSLPLNPEEGWIVFDSDTKKFMGYAGAVKGWVEITTA